MKSKIQDSKKSNIQNMGKKFLLLAGIFILTFSVQAQDKKQKTF